ncbi:MAG: hypothetical protein ACI9MC_003979 [Kiritimatiellia bacterium]|jgi:hypothetical protein
MIPPALLHRLGQLQRSKSMREFSSALKDPTRAQQLRLRQILQRNASTTYGESLGFDPTWTTSDYAVRAPIIDASDLAPWVARSMAGERGVLTADDPLYYVRTTGTTGAAKHIPITASYTREFQKPLHVSLWHLYRKYPRAFRGRALYFVAPPDTGKADDGLTVGTMSGYNYSALPKIVRALYAWPTDLFAITDLRARSFLALYGAAQHRITFAASVFPLTLVLLLRTLHQEADRLAYHLERGTLPDDLDLPDPTPFARWLKPNPAAAARLRAAANDPEHACRHVFPDLRLVLCWTGASAGLYVSELERLVGPNVAVRDAVYSASEGWLNSPLGDSEPGGPVGITGHYVEWRPSGGGEPVGVMEMEQGQQYEPILTTSAGLYRYALGDLVRVTGRHEGLPCIAFEQKASASCNISGEKLAEVHVNNAVGPALREVGLHGAWFCVCPSERRPGYDLFLECPDVPEGLDRTIDAALAALNIDYADVRSEGSLLPLRIKRVPPGSSDDRRQALASAGVPVEQLKAQHLIDTPWTPD